MRPIASSDLPDVGLFLHQHLNPGLAPEGWESALTPTWQTSCPTHGFALWSGERIVGVYAGFYSERPDGAAFCNLAAWCVLEEFRPHSLLLARAMLRQRDRDLTDFSPSGAVVPTNERLGLQHLDTAGSLVINLPVARSPRAVRIVSDADSIARLLPDADRAAFEDHRHAAAARHLALVTDDRVCWIVYRTVRRKRLPLFASILHVSDRDLFQEAAGVVYRHLLFRGLPFTLTEDRVAGPGPWHARRLAVQRPKMYLSRAGAAPESVSQLYSELTQVPW